MSEMQERAKRLIAEAHALMEKARADVKRAREVIERSGIDPADVPAQFNKAFGDKGPVVMEQLLQEQLQMAREAIARDAPPVQPTHQPPTARIKKLRRMV